MQKQYKKHHKRVTMTSAQATSLH